MEERTRYTMGMPVEIKFCAGSGTGERDLAEIAKTLLPLEIERGTAEIKDREIEVVSKKKILSKAEAEKESKLWEEFLRFKNQKKE